MLNAIGDEKAEVFLPAKSDPTKTEYVTLLSITNGANVDNVIGKFKLFFDKDDHTADVDYNGAKLVTIAGSTITSFDGFVIIGNAGNIKRVIDAHRNGSTINHAPIFKQDIGTLPGPVGMRIYLDSNYSTKSVASIAARLGMTAATPKSLSAITGFAVKDNDGLHGRIFSATGLAAMLIPFLSTAK